MRSLFSRSAVAGLALAALAASASLAFAETVKFSAKMNGPSEVPATTSKGTGQIEASFDTATKMLTWNITYSGLTGPATAAHFHGPATPDKAVPPTLPIPADKLASPITGSATLTDQQANDLMAGLWYFNVHTAENKPGEIRGQLAKSK